MQFTLVDVDADCSIGVLPVAVGLFASTALFALIIRWLWGLRGSWGWRLPLVGLGFLGGANGLSWGYLLLVAEASMGTAEGQTVTYGCATRSWPGWGIVATVAWLVAFRAWARTDGPVLRIRPQAPS